MLIVPIEEARPGMKLAAPVLNPENTSQQLLRAGYVLTQPVVERMVSIGIPFVYVEYPGLDALDRHLAVYLSPARQAVYRDIKATIAQVQKHTRPGISYEAYCTTTRELIDTLMTQGQNPIYLDQMSRQGSDLVSHAAAVAHLSLLLGLSLEEYLVEQRSRLSSRRARQVVGLGVAGMLHDLGISRLPESLQGYSEVEPPLDRSERAEWESHAQIGYELIRNDVEATAAVAVFQHHQHFDGSGFPTLSANGQLQGAMSGRRIHVFARIILCANLYDRLSTPVRGGPRRSNIEVLRLIRSRYAAWCDPHVLRALQAVAPPFPPGYRLRLADGSHAVVTDVNPARPMLPTVQRLGKDNWTMVGPPLDLSAPGAPGIAGVSEEDLIKSSLGIPSSA